MPCEEPARPGVKPAPTPNPYLPVPGDDTEVSPTGPTSAP